MVVSYCSSICFVIPNFMEKLDCLQNSSSAQSLTTILLFEINSLKNENSVTLIPVAHTWPILTSEESFTPQ